MPLKSLVGLCQNETRLVQHAENVLHKTKLFFYSLIYFKTTFTILLFIIVSYVYIFYLLLLSFFMFVVTFDYTCIINLHYHTSLYFLSYQTIFIFIISCNTNLLHVFYIFSSIVLVSLFMFVTLVQCPYINIT